MSTAPRAGRPSALAGFGASIRDRASLSIGGVNPGLVIALVVLFVGLSLLSPVFLQPTNLANIGKAVAITGIVAAGETVVIISGGFDLSVGSVMAAAGMTAAYSMALGAPLPVAFGLALLLGLGIGLANGAVVSYARINPLITTLATLAIVRGIAYVVSGGREKVISDPFWLSLGTGTFLGVPYLIVMLLATFLIVGWAMPRTPYGRYAYAIGSNARASRLAGVAVDRWRIAFYLTSGLLAAVGGLLLTARTGNAQPTAGTSYELDVITAVILGGASLSGGRGTLAGTLVALLVLGMVNNGLTLLNVPAYWQGVVKGTILLTAVVYDELRRHQRDET